MVRSSVSGSENARWSAMDTNDVVYDMWMARMRARAAAIGLRCKDLGISYENAALPTPGTKPLDGLSKCSHPGVVYEISYCDR
jgi:hypothetical protein